MSHMGRLALEAETAATDAEQEAQYNLSALREAVRLLDRLLEIGDDNVGLYGLCNEVLRFFRHHDVEDLIPGSKEVH